MNCRLRNAEKFVLKQKKLRKPIGNYRFKRSFLLNSSTAEIEMCDCHGYFAFMIYIKSRHRFVIYHN